MLLEQRHTKLPLFDTTRIHAEEAVRWALARPWPSVCQSSELSEASDESTLTHEYAAQRRSPWPKVSEAALEGL
jgi:hypothetical protein